MLLLILLSLLIMLLNMLSTSSLCWWWITKSPPSPARNDFRRSGTRGNNLRQRRNFSTQGAVKQHLLENASDKTYINRPSLTITEPTLLLPESTWHLGVAGNTSGVSSAHMYNITQIFYTVPFQLQLASGLETSPGRSQESWLHPMFSRETHPISIPFPFRKSFSRDLPS